MKKNIAVVGCGYWGKNLVRNFANLGSLYAVSDYNTEIANKFALQYDVRSYSFDEIVISPNIKGIVLAVPANLHAPMAIAALNAGKHVFVEKPLAMNENEANIMIATARKKNVQLMVGHLLQYHPVFKTLHKFVGKGKIGKLNFIQSSRLSFGKVRSQEDVLWSFAPHDISMILSLADEEPMSVRSDSISILQKNISDTAAIYMKFKSGLKSNISVSWLHPYKESKIMVVGSSAIMIFDDTKTWKEKLALYPFDTYSSHDIVDLQKHDLRYIDVIEEEPLKIECQHFINVVETNIKPLTDGFEGLRVLKVLTAATKFQNEN